MEKFLRLRNKLLLDIYLLSGQNVNLKEIYAYDTIYISEFDIKGIGKCFVRVVAVFKDIATLEIEDIKGNVILNKNISNTIPLNLIDSYNLDKILSFLKY